MKIIDPEFKIKVDEFSKKNSINGNFVMNAILCTAKLKNENNSMWNDSSMILYTILKCERKAIAMTIEEKLQKDTELSKEYNMPVTPQHLASLPLHIKIRLNPDTKKIKDLVINTALIKQYDSVHNSLTPIEIIDMILEEFNRQINKISKHIKKVE